jgi:hypothetical protein
VMTQSSLSQSMMVRSKSNTTTTPGAGADAMSGGWQGEGGQAGLPGSPRLLFGAVGGVLVLGSAAAPRLLSSALYIAIAHLLGGGVADLLGLRVASWSAVTCVAFCHLLVAVALHSAAVCLLFVWLLLAVSCLLARICSRLRVLHHILFQVGVTCNKEKPRSWRLTPSFGFISINIIHPHELYITLQ